MQRRQILGGAVALAASSLGARMARAGKEAAGKEAAGKEAAGKGAAGKDAAKAPAREGVGSRPAGALEVPPVGDVPIAFLLSPGATIIDFCGPWEVFQDVHLPERGATMEEQMPFKLYTVAETLEPIRASGGMKILPNHTFATAPKPALIVVPAQQGKSPALLEWLRVTSRSAQLTMSVCTGAFVLGRAGLLDGLPATTHHYFFDDFARAFPKVELRRGVRFVENGRVATAAGLSSGIDLALRVVDRSLGREVAERTAAYMEYQGRGWQA